MNSNRASCCIGARGRRARSLRSPISGIPAAAIASPDISDFAAFPDSFSRILPNTLRIPRATMNNPKHIDPRLDPTRTIRAPRGAEKTCKSWLTEAAYRMIQNNLDAEVAEHPHALVVYGGIGRAARNWDCFDQILATLKDLNDDETLLIQSGKPVGVFKTHADAPRVLLANSNLVPHWATW